MFCAMFGHKPDRRRVWNDGLDFRCPCLRCGLPMLRDLDGWRLFESDRDQPPGSLPRSSRPDHGHPTPPAQR